MPLKGFAPKISCLLAALVALCFSGSIAGSILLLVPQQAEQQFGPPAPYLPPLQRLTLSLQLLAYQQDLLTPISPAVEDLTFQVALGESIQSISRRLQAAGYIGNAEAFRLFLIYSGLDRSIQAGEYRFAASQTAMEIAKSMQDATPAEVEFNILPGWRLEEIAAALPTSGLEVQPEVLIRTAYTRPAEFAFIAELPPGISLEGFFFPGLYRLPRRISADELITAFLNAFDANVDPDLRFALARHNLNLHQAVTLASIIQREAIDETEMPVIASVFYNRMAAGMKLDSDPTVQYALGYNETQRSWWTNPLSAADLQVNSPYNTYLSPGLPPGPIANPGLAALRAAAFPAQTPYFFFRAACDQSGKHTFAQTFEEHLNNACP